VRFSIAVLLLLVFIGAAAAYSGLPGVRESGVFNSNPPTPYFHYFKGVKPVGRLLVVHGLGGNKAMLNPICYSLADAGIDVFSIDLPGHGSSSASFNGMVADDVVAQILTQLGPETNVLGHSFGGALLLDVGASRHVRKMVLFSPAPTTVDNVQADSILLFQGQLDLFAVRRFTPDLNSILQGRVEFHDVPWTDHTGALVDEQVIRQVAEFLGGNPQDVHTRWRSLLPIVMLLSSVAFGVLLLDMVQVREPVLGVATLSSNKIVWYVAAAALGTIVPVVIHITQWLHLFAADYLMGFLFVTGLVLCLTCHRVPVEWGRLSVGVAAAAYAIAIPGLLVVSKLMEMSLSGPRLLRFVMMAALALPFFVADEMLIRPIRPAWQRIFAMLLTRALLGAILITAVLEWGHDSGFLYFMMNEVVSFWIGLWFVGAFIHRRTKDPVSTAVFMSIVQGWIFAALFVTT
jgi:pimeloyl-ACP methyl ester carboxylesterase